jgi:glycosyltransferase involved in cell wall biosynthesis
MVEFFNGKWCCVYVGSIVKSECIDYLLDSWKLITDNRLYFAIVGEGAEKERIQRRIQEENIKNVQMFPAVKPEEVPLVLEKADCCVAALEFGKLGQYGLSKYKLNDYLYSGTPTVFACDSPNIVEEAGHFSLPIGDASVMAKTIQDISQMDSDQLEQLKIRGKEYIKNYFDYKTVGEKYLSLIEML